MVGVDFQDGWRACDDVALQNRIADGSLELRQSTTRCADASNNTMEILNSKIQKMEEVLSMQ